MSIILCWQCYAGNVMLAMLCWQCYAGNVHEALDKKKTKSKRLHNEPLATKTSLPIVSECNHKPPKTSLPIGGHQDLGRHSSNHGDCM